MVLSQALVVLRTTSSAVGVIPIVGDSLSKAVEFAITAGEMAEVRKLTKSTDLHFDADSASVLEISGESGQYPRVNRGSRALFGYHNKTIARDSEDQHGSA